LASPRSRVSRPSLRTPLGRTSSDRRARAASFLYLPELSRDWEISPNPGMPAAKSRSQQCAASPFILPEVGTSEFYRHYVSSEAASSVTRYMVTSFADSESGSGNEDKPPKLCSENESIRLDPWNRPILVDRGMRRAAELDVSISIFGLTLFLTAAGVVLGGLLASRRGAGAAGGGATVRRTAVAARPPNRFDTISSRSSRSTSRSHSRSHSRRSHSRSTSQRTSLEIAAQAAAEELLSGSSASPKS